MHAPAALKNLLGAHCVDDAERLRKYEIPERGPPGHASCVLLPESDDEVAAILRTCNQYSLKLVLSAGRTGLVEAQRPEGEAVLSLERLNKILSIDEDRCTVTAEAGVSIDALNAQLDTFGLMFPMEMGSSSAATIGGCVANAAAGANAVCYGTAAHMCAAAWGYWGNGEVAGPCAADAWQPASPDALLINSARIHPQWGLVGSQGVLGVVTRVQLRLQTIPAEREAALIPVADMAAAMQVLVKARASFGVDIEEFEFISRSAMNLVREARGTAFRLPFSRDSDAPLFLLLQLKSTRVGDELSERLYDFLSTTLALREEDIGYAPLRPLKEIRHSITESSNARMRKLGGGRLSFDTAVPLSRCGAYLDELERKIRCDYPGVEFVAFGHAGVGGAHLHLLGTREMPVTAHAQALTALVFDVTTKFGGTFSAEHGVGSKWGAEFIKRAPAEQRAELLAAKRLHDPRNVLNPRCFGLDQLLV